MSRKNNSAGRGPYERISVLKMPGSARVVLGESEPSEQDRRTRAIQQWGQPHPSPRKAPLNTIDQPLPARVQTALSYSVDPALAQQLQGGMSPSPVSRRDAERSVQARVDVNVGVACNVSSDGNAGRKR